MDKIKQLKEIVDISKRIVFFGGAGVSTESGIPDFRSASGIYNEKFNKRYTPEEIVSRSFFFAHPKDFYEFYINRMVYPNAKPNNAHKALAELERIGKLHAIITQNIDGLHQLAGSKNVYELHGTIHQNFCNKCHKEFSLGYILSHKVLPKCDECGTIVKPNVILYQENLDKNILNNAIDEIKNCDTLIIGGTSLVVYPAATLVKYFRGQNLVLINKSVTPMDEHCDLVLHDSIGDILSQVVNIKTEE